MNIEYINVKDIIPYENNPRHNDNAVDYVANSIKEFGFKVPIVIDSENVIVTGHTRLKAAEKLGMTECPCIRADDLTEAQIKAYRLADNKVSEYSNWDNDALRKELDSLFDNIDMNQFGFPVQIENIEIEDGKTAEYEIASELNEANNYVVLQFNTEEDWQDAIIKLDLKKVSTNEDNKKVRRHGIGRVIDGKKVIDKL